MAAPNFQNGTLTATLAAGVATTVDVPIGGASNWTIVLSNTGANPITAVTIAVSTNTTFEAAASITTGLPLAAGSSLPAIVGSMEPCFIARLVITSAVGSAVRVEYLGT